ncbi:MAG: alpha/beta hydrolase [Fimbriiglobus sp.]|nr:alpha/beta hydrolase [Fimbriiglobus sp.]
MPFAPLLLSVVLAADPTDLPLWGDKIPGPVSKDEKNIPTLTFHPASAEKATGTAVVVCPGGGYAMRATDHEGKQIVEWLNARGVHAAVLKYRTANESKITPPLEPGPMLDVQRAIRIVRAKAKDWNVDPKRVGVWGFSAGGHLASTAATHFDAGKADAADPIEKQSCRPDFAILAYPVISMAEGVTHGGSKNNLLGKSPDAKLVEFYSNEKQVTKETPPTFLFHTAEDKAVLIRNSELFYDALKKAGVEGCKLYTEEKGPHGVGLGQKLTPPSKWPTELEAWMKERGLLTKK